MAPNLISTREAARRLNVKPATLYAYVSRGMIRSHRVAGERTSWFDQAEIDALAGGRGGGRPPGFELGIETAITLIDGRRLWYRGRDAVDLARNESFESVASMLWADAGGAGPWTAPATAVEAATRAGTGLGPGARLVDRLGLTVAVAATTDPLRFDLSTAAVTATGRALIATMVEALPRRGPAGGPDLVAAGGSPPDLVAAGGSGPDLVAAGGSRPDDPVAARLWPRLTDRPVTATAVRVLNGFLVLVADHELATSTLGARVAASTRANPYAVVAGALNVLDGPLHGTVSDQVVGLLEQAAGAGGPPAAIGSWLRHGRPLPGFGQPLYHGDDPRGRAMLEFVTALAASDPDAAARWEVVQGVVAAASGHMADRPNSDFGLGSLAFVAGMPADAGGAIFAVGRCAGWIAHALEEYAAPPLRFRGRALYTGLAPTGPAEA